MQQFIIPQLYSLFFKSYLDGSCPKWQVSGWQLSLVAIVRVAIILGGNCLGGNYPGGNYPGGNCPGGNCPRTEETGPLYSPPNRGPQFTEILA